MQFGCAWAGGLDLREVRRAANVALALLGSVMAGCGGGTSGPPLVPVEGVVTLDGRPLANAQVMFIPQGDTPGQALFGRTDAEGRFILASPDGKLKGAAVGSYRVTIQKLVKPDGSDFIPDPNAGPMDTGGFRELLPPRYGSEAETQLTAEVPPGGTRELKFALQLRGA